MKILIKRDMLTDYIANAMIYFVSDIDYNLLTGELYFSDESPTDITINYKPYISIKSNSMFDGDVHEIEVEYLNPNKPDMVPLIYTKFVRTDKKTKLSNTFITIPYTDYIIVNREKLIKLCIKTLKGILQGMDNSEYYLELIEEFNIRHHIRERRRRHY